jgi:hypothetical protein
VAFAKIDRKTGSDGAGKKAIEDTVPRIIGVCRKHGLRLVFRILGVRCLPPLVRLSFLRWLCRLRLVDQSRRTAQSRDDQ